MCNFFSFNLTKGFEVLVIPISNRGDYENPESHTSITNFHKVDDDSVWKFEITMEPKQWDKFINGEDGIDVVMAHLHYDGGLPEENLKNTHYEAIKNYLIKIKESGILLERLTNEYPDEFLPKMQFSEVEGKVIEATKKTWQRIFDSCPYYKLKTLKLKIDNLPYLKNILGEDETFLGYLYLKEFFHPKTGEKMKELRGNVFSNPDLVQPSAIDWDEEVK